MRIALSLVCAYGAHNVAHLAHIHGIGALVCGAVVGFVCYDRMRR